MANRGSKPGEHRGGRKKGTPNEITTDLRKIILGALESLDADKYMRAIAIKQPVAFCALLGKLIPKDMNLALPVVQPKPWSKASMVDVGRRLAFVLAVADHDADKKVEPTGQAVSKAGAIKRVRTSSGGNAVK